MRKMFLVFIPPLQISTFCLLLDPKEPVQERSALSAETFFLIMKNT